MREDHLRKIIRNRILVEMTRDDENRVRDLVRIELAKLWRSDYEEKVDKQITNKFKGKDFDAIIYDLVRKFMRKHYQLQHQDYRFYLDKVKP